MFYALGQASPEEFTYFLLNIFYALAKTKHILEIRLISLSLSCSMSLQVLMSSG